MDITSEKPTDSESRLRRRPLLIENVFEKETTESYIERHFRDCTLHRCRCTAEFEVDAIVEQYRADLIRSAQEIEPDPKGPGFLPSWTMLLFERSDRLFWHFVIKANNAYAGKKAQKEISLTVTADSPQKAAEDALNLQKHFTHGDDASAFFLLSDLKNPSRIPLKPEYLLSDEMLDLHYGAGFSTWSHRFAQGLSQNGLSILRGKPGTGKTSFLRHLILKLHQTHRFYYIPTESFALLQGRLTDFIAREQERFKEAVLVLVLEDAEQLLADRRGFRDGLASSLLNFTDGFVSDIVRAHLVCTINGDFEDLDKAVLRPGRQRFFHEFELLEWNRAVALAKKLGTDLKEKRSYSLAELYHYKDVQDQDRLRGEEKRIGFHVE